MTSHYPFPTLAPDGNMLPPAPGENTWNPDRERALLAMARDGCTARQIARGLGIKPESVRSKAHRMGVALAYEQSRPRGKRTATAFTRPAETVSDPLLAALYRHHPERAPRRREGHHAR